MKASGRTHAQAFPERTCVGCRTRAAKGDLLRIAVIEGECVPDPRGTLPGRGAYLHPAPACLDLAVRRRALPRAFRERGPLGTDAVRAFLGRPAGEAPPRASRGEQAQR
ncbi:YlxR family protein [Streptomyces zingiberis]|uniref:YlxR family protein n=1 Tax=Streptomyces zingiberis TaxID=2053010 RepID=UPI001F0D4B44|nr:YlxR family protein [Streptomyces zingiberis]